MTELEQKKNKQPGLVLPVKIHYVFVDTLKSQIEPWQNLNVVLSKLFIQVLKLRFGFQLPLENLCTLAKKQHLELSATDIQLILTSL